jgi:hypothetical protein
MRENNLSVATNPETVRWSLAVQRVQIAPTVTTGCLIILALIVFNAFPDRLGLVRSVTDPSSYVLWLGPGFYDEILPRLNVLWGFSLGVILTNLYYGHWTWGTRLLDYALTIFSVAILAKLLFGSETYLALQWQELEMLVVHIAGRTVPLVMVGVKAALGGALLGAVVSLGVKVRPLVRSAVRLTS